MVKIGINGFGRIGRAFFRAGFKALNIVAINSPSNAENIAHLLKYDTVYGKFPGKIRYTKNALYVNGKKIKLFFEREPEKIPWKDLGVHIVVECSGIFCDKDSASKHLKAGAKKVIISAPAKGVNLTVVNGINDKKIKKQKIISNASCTTNCLAPIAKIIDDNLGLKRGFMTTIHSYTKDQNLVDATHKKDYRRGRAAASNIVPTTSGASLAVGQVIPKLKGKLHSEAARVPVIDGSVIYLVCEIKKKKTVEKINKIFKKSSQKKYKGILEYSEEPIVSSDVIGNLHAAVFDSLLTQIDGDLLKVVAWYDNEMGYSFQLVQLIKKFSKK